MCHVRTQKARAGTASALLQPPHTQALAFTGSKMRRKIAINFVVVGIGSFICGLLLYGKVLPGYIEGQIDHENRIGEIARKIRTGELEIEPAKMANLLKLAVDRSAEIFIVKLYVWVAIISVSISLFTYAFGVYMGIKEYKKANANKSSKRDA